MFILGWTSRGQDKASAMASFLSLAKLFHMPGGVSSSSSSRPWLQDLQQGGGAVEIIVLNIRTVGRLLHPYLPLAVVITSPTDKQTFPCHTWV
jgi:hypothetical protein